MAKNRKKKGPSPRTKTDVRSAAEKKQDKTNIIMTVVGVAVLVLVIALIIVLIVTSLGDNNTSQNPENESASTESIAFDVNENYIADIDIKDYGTITVALNSKAAPITVENFVKLASSGFYDNLTFHRIIEGFMMQGGDPNGDGTGGSDETIYGEFSANGYDNPLKHSRGTISMARSAASMNSASSQFFIVQQDAASLDGQYATFGEVTEGMEIVDKICSEAEPIDNNGLIATKKQPVINSIKIRTADTTE